MIRQRYCQQHFISQQAQNDRPHARESSARQVSKYKAVTDHRTERKLMNTTSIRNARAMTEPPAVHETWTHSPQRQRANARSARGQQHVQPSTRTAHNKQRERQAQTRITTNNENKNQQKQRTEGMNVIQHCEPRRWQRAGMTYPRLNDSMSTPRASAIVA